VRDAAVGVLPFVYLTAIGAGFLASDVAVVQQLGFVAKGGLLLIFWQFQQIRRVLRAPIGG
jgi:phospholipid/cholesterol/gamma-HCH transport system permease protein